MLDLDKNDGTPLGEAGSETASAGERQEAGAQADGKENRMTVLGLSRTMQVFIETAIAGGVLETKEIALLRRKAAEFGDDPDVVELAAKAEMADFIEENKPETVTIYVKPKKSIFGYFFGALKKYCVFKGRARRAEFWQFVLLSQIIVCGLMIADGIMLGSADAESTTIGETLVIILGLIQLGTLLPFIALWARRIHDTNHSAWFILLPLYNYFLLFKPGTAGPNRFGEDPKAPVAKEMLVERKTGKKRAVEAARREEKQAAVAERFQIVGGTLFGAGGIAHEAIERKLIKFENLDSATTVIWIIGAFLIVLPKILAWLKKRSADGE